MHRIGRRRGDGIEYPRPIVAKFEKYRDREVIRVAGLELNKKRGQFSIREQFPVEMEAKRKRLYPVMRKYQQNRRNKVSLVRDKLYVNGLLYDEENGVLVRPTKSSISNYRSEHTEDSSHRMNGTEREGSTRRILKANRPSVSFEHENRFDILNDTSGEEAELSFVNEAMRTKRKPTSPAFNETLAKKPQQTGKARINSGDDSIVEMEAGQVAVTAEVYHSASNEPDVMTPYTNMEQETIPTSVSVMSTGVTQHNVQAETSLTSTSSLIVSSMRVNTVDFSIVEAEGGTDFAGEHGTSSMSLNGACATALEDNK